MQTRTRYFTLMLLTVGTFLTASQQLYADSAAELLEKGIYSEETTGDLSQAIEHYRQVISSAKETESLAAQAQYRLGRCLHKLGRRDEAREAFEELIKRYPDQKELIAQARRLLPAHPVLLPPTWKSGECLTMTMALANGRPIGVIGTAVTAGQKDGRDVWQMDVRRYIVGGINSGVSRVIIDQENNLPLTTHWDHTLLGQADGKWTPEEIIITTPGKDGDEATKTIELDAPGYCNDQWMFGFRQLPMEIGKTVTLPVRVSFTGGNLVEMEMTIAAKEEVETPVGTFDCFRLDTNIQQTFWITDTPERYIARFDAGGVVAKLTSIGTEESLQLTNEQLNFSVSRPGGWFHFVPKSDNDTTSGGFHLVAPSAHVATSVQVRKKSLLDAQERESPDARIGGIVQSIKDRHKGATVRDNSRTTVPVAGEDGIIVVLDYSSAGTDLTVSRTVSFHGDRVIEVTSLGQTAHFERHMKDFEAIRESLTVE